jgi:O-antigen/teichoic acid export membrane protein
MNSPKSSIESDGRSRIPINILSSWGGLFVQTISGFIIPRLVDNTLGQDQLGIWDFAWTIVAYIGLVQGSITSSINRYVALYNSNNDFEGMNRSVSSVTVVLIIMSAIIFLLTIICSLEATRLFGTRLIIEHYKVSWLVFLLGMSLIVQVAFSAYGGVLTGLHRWDLHNLLFAITNIVSMIAMIVALKLDMGLIGLGGGILIGESIGWIARVFVAHQICKRLIVRFSLFDWTIARDMIFFGGKNFVPRIGDIVLNQTVNMFIVAYFGPAALALFSRPRNLVRTVVTLMSRYASVLVPTASAMHGINDQKSVKELIIKNSRFSVYICLPMILLMIILGGDILQVWMGAKYRNGPLMAIMALGQLLYIVYLPLLSVISGLNLHGRPGIANLCAQAVSLVCCYIAIRNNTGLIGLTIAITVPLSLVNGIYLPLYACRKVRIPFGNFLIQTWRGPLACCIPFTIIILLCRWLFAGSPIAILAAGSGFGYITLAFFYWNRIVPVQWKKSIVSNISQLFKRK